MATTERDYYELLRSARRVRAGHQGAFRKLARELHPDVSDEPDAETRFREVAEAYQVLSNSETRELYDRYGHAGLRGGGFTPGSFDFGSISDIFSAFFGDNLFGAAAGRRARGADIAAEVEIELVEAAKGATREVPFGVTVACARCDASGAEPGTNQIDCPTCAGAGRVQQVTRSVFGEFVRSQACPRCGGAGRIVTTPCTACEGSGRTARSGARGQDPAGDPRRPADPHQRRGPCRAARRPRGRRLRPGAREAGRALRARGRRHLLDRRPEHRPGRDRDERHGRDARRPARARVPPGTQPGEIRVLSGRGMPVLQGFGRGDHRVLVNVAVPHRLTEEQRRLLEEFDRLSSDETYAQHESFFDKLKSAFR